MPSSSTASKLAGLDGLAGAKRLVTALARPDSGVHAVLFYGAAGSGKRTLAEELARAWLCRQNVDGACGECQACQAFGRGTNADFLRISPGGLSSWIVLGDISESKGPGKERPVVPLKTFFRTGPIQSTHKVALIERADRMNADAANSLLKTLEEPSPYGKILLTTDSVGRVLPTILSRCVSVCCELPDERSELASPEAWTLARGAPGQAKRIMENWSAYEDLMAFAEVLIHARSHQALALSERFQSIAEKLETSDAAKREEQVEGLRALAEVLRLKRANPEWVQRVVQAHRWMAGNANPSIVFDSLFIALLQDRAPGPEAA